MTETTIRADSDVMTLVNVFTVSSSRQQELVDVLVGATERSWRTYPASSPRTSTAATTAPGWSTTRSGAAGRDFTAMQADPRAREHMMMAADVARFDPIVCEVAYSHHA